MNTITITVKDQLKDVLADLVDFESAGYETQPNTLKNVATNLWNECAQYNRGTQANKFTEGLQGLPSYINIPFYNWDIEKLMYSLGYELDDSVEKYWVLCGVILSEEFNK